MQKITSCYLYSARQTQKLLFDEIFLRPLELILKVFLEAFHPEIKCQQHPNSQKRKIYSKTFFS